jgi:hypothetical protein
MDQLQKSCFNQGCFTCQSLEKSGFIALVAAYIYYKRPIPQGIVTHAGRCCSRGQIASQHYSTLYLNWCIMYKHAVALKALNPRDLTNKDIISYQLFWNFTEKKKNFL